MSSHNFPQTSVPCGWQHPTHSGGPIQCSGKVYEASFKMYPMSLCEAHLEYYRIYQSLILRLWKFRNVVIRLPIPVQKFIASQIELMPWTEL